MSDPLSPAPSDPDQPADVSVTADDSLTEAAVEEVLAEGDGPLENEAPIAPETPVNSADGEASGDDAKPATPPPAPPPAAPAKLPEVDPPDDEAPMDWYILKVAFNREDSIADALRKRVAREGMQEHFADIVVPTEDVVNFTRDGKRRITKQKLYPGYIMVNMRINDDTWFLVRETGGISDFTGAAGKPMPMDPADVERIIHRPVEEDEEEEPQMKIGIPFKVGDRVRVKEGNFENQEGDVDAVDETNGNITVIINIFGRSVPMELKHFQVEPL